MKRRLGKWIPWEAVVEHRLSVDGRPTDVARTMREVQRYQWVSPGILGRAGGGGVGPPLRGRS
jgi:hypothetical protein